MIITTDMVEKYSSDTISAIATANGVGSVAIIRISGDKALDIAKKITKHEQFHPRVAILSDIYNKNSEFIDEAIVIYFKSPHSFTGEDIVEIQCHGGFVVAQNILKTTIFHGARVANGGEFSKRAFFNGKMDLSKAEAIAKLIEAKSQDAAKILATQMKGSLREYVEKIRDDLVHILAFSEVSIDYAEEDLPQNLLLQIESKLIDIKKSLLSTLSASKSREGLMQGFRVAIIGKPNVGKSSLLNSLLNYSRAIVSDIAGTTRDTIEEQIKIGTHLIRITDTAGIREADDEIEKIGIERSLAAVKESDIVVVLFDGSREFDSDDEKIVELIESEKDGKTIFYVKNKIDLEVKFFNESIKFDLEINSKESVDQLILKLETTMNRFGSMDEMMLISQRQISAVQNTLKNIEDSFLPLKDVELEIFSFHLNDAIKEISSITRPFENDEMLDKMFSSFCLGK